MLPFVAQTDAHETHTNTHAQLKIRRQAPPGTFPESAGIGVNLQKLPKYLMYQVTQMAPNGGAALNGQVSVGDVIFTVDGTDVTQLELPALIQTIKGKTNTFVTLVVQRGEPFAEGRRKFEELQQSHQAEGKSKQQEIRRLEQDAERHAQTRQVQEQEHHEQMQQRRQERLEEQRQSVLVRKRQLAALAPEQTAPGGGRPRLKAAPPSRPLPDTPGETAGVEGGAKPSLALPTPSRIEQEFRSMDTQQKPPQSPQMLSRPEPLTLCIRLPKGVAGQVFTTPKVLVVKRSYAAPNTDASQMVHAGQVCALVKQGTSGWILILQHTGKLIWFPSSFVTTFPEFSYPHPGVPPPRRAGSSSSTSTTASGSHSGMCVYTYICIHLYRRYDMYICTERERHTHKYIHTHTHIHAHTNTHTQTRTHKHTRTNTRTHTHTHTQTHHRNKKK